MTADGKYALEIGRLATTLARIMGEVGRIEKKGRITSSSGSGPSYKFARDTDVLEVVGPKLAEAGIVLVPERTELLSMELNLRETQRIANIKTAWLVTDGREEIRFETLGQGQDTGDKALPKAQSNARKYAFFMLFHIVTGDDPDEHASDAETQRRKRSPARNEVNVLRDALADAAQARGIGHRRLEELGKQVGIVPGQATAEQLRQVLALIQSPEQANGAKPTDAETSGPVAPSSGRAQEQPGQDEVPLRPGSASTADAAGTPPLEGGAASVIPEDVAAEVPTDSPQSQPPSSGQPEQLKVPT